MTNDETDAPTLRGGGDGQDARVFTPSENAQSRHHNENVADLRVSSAKLFVQANEQTRMAICLCDPKLDDCPIIYTNRAFSEVTGYPAEEVIGRNCRFLQGKDTDPAAIAKLRQLVENEEYGVTDILNYRKDGTPFWNAVHIGPIYNEAGKLEYFYGSQWDITDLVEERERKIQQEKVTSELRHRTDNIFAVISAMVRLSAHGVEDAAELSDKLLQRIEALATAHRVSIDSENRTGATSDLHTLVDEILAPYSNGNPGRFQIAGQAVSLPRKAITPIGLALHELSTNAVKYGALSSDSGEVDLDWRLEDGLLHLDWRESGGPAVSTPGDGDRPNAHGSGSRIIGGVLGGLKGTIDFDYRPEGLHAEICLPI